MGDTVTAVKSYIFSILSIKSVTYTELYRDWQMLHVSADIKSLAWQESSRANSL